MEMEMEMVEPLRVIMEVEKRGKRRSTSDLRNVDGRFTFTERS